MTLGERQYVQARCRRYADQVKRRQIQVIRDVLDCRQLKLKPRRLTDQTWSRIAAVYSNVVDCERR